MARFSIKNTIKRVSCQLSYSKEKQQSVVQKVYDTLQIAHHMNFAQRPPNDLLFDWHVATSSRYKDIDYWYDAYKELLKYTVPEIKYITIYTTIEKPKENEENVY